MKQSRWGVIFSTGKAGYWSLVVLLFAIALGMRMYPPGEPGALYGREFDTLQYCRYFYVHGSQVAPSWKLEVVDATIEGYGGNGKMIRSYHQQICAAIYRIVGEGRIWPLRLLSSVVWLIGGVFLLLLLRMMFDADTTLLGIGTYLLLPFAVLYSRYVMTDPLMVAWFAASLYFVAAYFKRPSTRLMAACLATSAICIYTKPFCVFALIGAFLALSASEGGTKTKKGIFSGRSALFIAVSVLPSLASYVYFTLTTEFGRSYLFSPGMLLHGYFWKGWFSIIQSTVGLAPFCLSLVGVLLARDRFVRYLLSGLWIGYFAYCFFFTYWTHTHTYNHLLLMPIVALSLSPLFACVTDRLASSRPLFAVRACCMLLAVAAMAFVFQEIKPQLIAPARAETINEVKTDAEEIGRLVGHSTNTIILCHGYGAKLCYFGWFCGRNWPADYDFAAWAKYGIPHMTAKERLENDFLPARPDYFIIRAPLLYGREQPDLLELLKKDYHVVAANRRYAVYDMRHTQ
ncbi:MAG: glycosyltransferase family 39 protein [Armatimonadetes bacterium]|nr:glycosyltransferase family 39 protein [Armatimonadota bacterium]